MQRTPVKSSQIASVGYDPAAKLLEVEFHGSKGKPGTVYQYDNVTQDLYDGFLVTKEEDGSERSVGRYFTAYIKRWPLKYPYRKVEQESPADMLARLGTDADLWAREMFAKANLSDAATKDEAIDILRAWLANAIEAGRNAGARK